MNLKEELEELRRKITLSDDESERKGYLEKIEEIQQKISRTTIHISRVPEKTKTRFVEIANNEFEGDYGFCLKQLLDFRDGLLTTPNQMILDRIEILEEKINNLKIEDEPKTKKMVGGRILRIGGGKDE